MKTMIPLALVFVGALFAAEPAVGDWSGEVAAAKPFLLEVRFSESATALENPPEEFLQSARRVDVAVAESDAGFLSSSDGGLTFTIRRSGTAFLTQLRLVMPERVGEVASQRTVNTRTVLAEGKWTQLGATSRSLDGGAPKFFYVFARVVKNG
jgi:hypothetical protein